MFTHSSNMSHCFGYSCCDCNLYTYVLSDLEYTRATVGVSLLCLVSSVCFSYRFVFLASECFQRGLRTLSVREWPCLGSDCERGGGWGCSIFSFLKIFWRIKQNKSLFSPSLTFSRLLSFLCFVCYFSLSLFLCTGCCEFLTRKHHLDRCSYDLKLPPPCSKFRVHF